MADFSGFRPSDDIEDRRRTPFIPVPGTFGNGIDLPNIFDGGTMANLNAATDFAPQPNSPSQLSIDAGINSLPSATSSSAPGFSAPQGLLSGIAGPIINAESGGDANAKNPNSSASGPGQFLDSTFLDTIKSARPDLAQGKTDAELLTLKTDPDIGRQMTEAYAAQNQAILSKAGVPVTPGSTYLAHFAGPGGAVKVLQADPNAPVSDILGPAVVKANPFLAGMTSQGLQAWAAKKMGTSAPTPGAQPASPETPANGTQAIPQQAPPIFAPQPQAPQAAPSTFAQMPAEQPMSAPPIFTPPRKPIDLSGLRAALANRAPIFSGQG